MHTLKVYASLVLLLFAFPSFALDDCSPVRLDEKGGSMEHIGTREQVGGTCFFEVATQLFDAYRMKLGAYAHSNSSGFMGALEMAKKKGTSTLDNDGEGGYVCDAFDFLVENGILNEQSYSTAYGLNDKSLSHRIHMLNYQREIYLTKMHSARERFIDEYMAENSILAQDHTSVSSSNQTSQLRAISIEKQFMEKHGNAILDYTASMAVYYVKDFFKDSEIFNYQEFFKKVLLKYATNELKFIEEIMSLHTFKKEMRNTLYGALPSCRSKYYTFFSSNFEVLRDINHNFSKGKKSFPISVNLCSNLYESGRNYNPGVRTVGTFVNEENCGQHAVILIGRRKNPETNRCQYLIKNSSGANTCLDGISNDWQCEKKIGSLWVDADKIAEATGRIEVIR